MWVCVCVRRWGDGWPLRDNRKEYKGPLAGVRAGKARRLLLRFRDSSPAVGEGGHSVPSPESGGSGKGRCLVVRLLSCSQFGNTGGGCSTGDERRWFQKETCWTETSGAATVVIRTQSEAREQPRAAFTVRGRESALSDMPQPGRRPPGRGRGVTSTAERKGLGGVLGFGHSQELSSRVERAEARFRDVVIVLTNTRFTNKRGA